jgi:hypothetical protein
LEVVFVMINLVMAPKTAVSAEVVVVVRGIG